MISFDVLQAIDTRLRDKMLARLAMRWPQAATYAPDSSRRVLCAHPLPDPDQVQLDTYTLAYQDAIEDILNMLDKSDHRPEPPLALRQAENSLFQGGTPPPEPRMPFRAAPRQAGNKKSGARGSEALRQLEDLFHGGGDG